MLKSLIISIMMTVVTFASLQAQTTHQDSLFKAAQLEVKRFKLEDADLRQFRKDKKNSNSDYFKPTKNNVTDTSLLKDSVFVKAYRELAYKKTRSRHTAGHYVLIVGISLAALVTIASIITANSDFLPSGN